MKERSSKLKSKFSLTKELLERETVRGRVIQVDFKKKTYKVKRKGRKSA